MAMNINKIDVDKLEYIKKYYKYKSADEICKGIDLLPHQVRDIARQMNITKRINSDDVCKNDKCWRDINYPNMTFSKYEISEYGHVRRKDNHILIQWTYTDDDYCEVKLVNDDNKRVSIRVHRLVAETFCFVRLTSQIEVNHLDGDKSNNYYLNLVWATPSENQYHSYKMGLRKPANLKHDLDTQIVPICKLIAQGLSNKEIFECIDFNIRLESIQNIRAKRTHQKISNKYF